MHYWIDAHIGPGFPDRRFLLGPAHGIRKGTCPGAMLLEGWGISGFKRELLCSRFRLVEQGVLHLVAGTPVSEVGY